MQIRITIKILRFVIRLYLFGIFLTIFIQLLIEELNNCHFCGYYEIPFCIDLIKHRMRDDSYQGAFEPLEVFSLAAVSGPLLCFHLLCFIISLKCSSYTGVKK